MTAIENNLLHNQRLQPLLKWAGGKEKELKYILPLIPPDINRYFEPFVGGGAVYFAIEANSYYINDKSYELIGLYMAIKHQDKNFFEAINEINTKWKYISKVVEQYKDFLSKQYIHYRNKSDLPTIQKEMIEFLSNRRDVMNSFSIFEVCNDYSLEKLANSLVNKFVRMKKVEQKKGLLPDKDIIDNIESAFKAAFYTKIRHIYNHKKDVLNNGQYTALFFFIRNYAYSGMFRYNSDGHFNVPYGGIGYNSKTLDKKIAYFKSKVLIGKLNQTTINNLDFEDFLNQYKPKENDFIFLDPPYDSEFSTYAKNEFTQEDQKRLANYLFHCKAKWMLVIKNTDFIYNLYSQNGNLFIRAFNKKYLVSFKNRNNKNAQHLIITNYAQK